MLIIRHKRSLTKEASVYYRCVVVYKQNILGMLNKINYNLNTNSHNKRRDEHATNKK